MTAASGLWTVGAAVEHWAAAAADRDAVRFEGAALTYAELARQARRVGHAMLAHGAGPGSRFAVLDKNRPEFFPIVYGGTMAGAVHVAMNWRSAAPEIAHVVRDAGVGLLFLGAELVDKITAIEDEVADCQVVAIDPGSPWSSLADWLGDAPDEPLPITVDPDVAAFQFYTSGTTGRPKGVPLSHRSCFTQLHGLGAMLRLDERATTLMAMPAFHIAGTQWSLQALCHGATAVMLRVFDPDEVLDAIERHGITHALLVPAMIQLVLDALRAATTDFSSLQMLSYGGSPIAPSVLASAMRTFDCDFCQTYGLTETGGAVSVLEPRDHDPTRPDVLRSAGQPVPWCEVRILDAATGEECPTGERGEVCVRSPAAMHGYWKLSEETAAAFHGEWLRTGDVGSFDERGYLTLIDRVKDLVVTGGENVYPAEVEHVLVNHPSVADAAVIGIPNERWGEAVHAVVVPRPGASVTADELIAFARQELAGFKLPKSVEFVAELPRNPSGKVLKTVLRAPHWAGRERAIN